MLEPYPLYHTAFRALLWVLLTIQEDAGGNSRDRHCLLSISPANRRGKPIDSVIPEAQLRVVFATIANEIARISRMTRDRDWIAKVRYLGQQALLGSMPEEIGQFLATTDPAPTPHAGYHGDRRVSPALPPSLRLGQSTDAPFFEGWYFRVCLPQQAESFAFMYAIEDPHQPSDRSGGSMQVLGPQDKLVVRSLPNVKTFWGRRDRLAFGHWGQVSDGEPLPQRRLSTGAFFQRVRSGYQVADGIHQGCLPLPSGDLVRWLFRVETIATYGIPDAKATMGWLSYLPVFEPGWQILMAYGQATGWVEWQGQRYEFEAAPAYAEKNWGGSFPQRWFWLQSVTFERLSAFATDGTQLSDTEIDRPLSLVCVGAWRDVLWWQEEVGMAAVHWGDRLIEFLPETSAIGWQISPWGSWQFQAETESDRITLEAWTDRPAAKVMVPTQQGMQFACRDTASGHLQLKLWRRVGEIWQLRLSASSSMAGLEVGGEPFALEWKRTLA